MFGVIMKIIGWLILEIVVFITMYLAFFQENVIATYFIEVAILISFFVSCFLVFSVKTGQVSTLTLQKPSNLITNGALIRDIVLSFIFLSFGWTYSSIAMLVICINNIIIVKHLDRTSKIN
jgi:hypothetical protein